MKHSKKNILICLFAMCVLFASCNPDPAKQTPEPQPTPSPTPMPTPSYEPYKIFNDDGTLNSIQYFNEKGQFTKIEEYYYVTEARYPNDYIRSIRYYQNGEENTYPVVFLQEEYEHLNYDKTASELVKKIDSSGTVIYEMSQKMKWAKMLENGTYISDAFPDPFTITFSFINSEESKIAITSSSNPEDTSKYYDIENTKFVYPAISYEFPVTDITVVSYFCTGDTHPSYRVID